MVFGLYYLFAGATLNEVCGFNSTRLSMVQLSVKGDKREEEALTKGSTEA